MKALKKIVLSFAIIFSAVTAVNFYNYAHIRGWFGENKITFETSYLGVKIGDSKSDVYFALGKPDFAPDFNKFPTLEDYVLGFYKKDGLAVSANHFIAVNIQKNKVIGLSASAKKNSYDAKMNLKWIELNTWEFKDIFARLGEPSKVFNVDEGVSRIFHFREKNILIGVEDGNINFIGVGNLFFRDELFYFSSTTLPFWGLNYSDRNFFDPLTAKEVQKPQ